ncbi:hypothetical protein Goari_004640, partial [Gossypium aridum]|nr:hypothetical protein [Gossypium aridum]
FGFQHLRKDGSDKLSSEAVEQVYDEACKRVKDSMPTPESSFVPQDNTVLENKVYTQVFGPDNYGKMLGYGLQEKTLLEEAESQFRTKAAEREARLIAEAEERFMKLTEIREAKFMDKMDAHEKKYRALLNECMAKGMSSKYKAFHSKYSKLTIL